MRYRLKRHPFRVSAHFDFSLAATFAFPEELLQPLLPPGLQLDSFAGFGFVAVALVQVRRLRPAILPSVFGIDFFLSGYRIFTRYQSVRGRSLRGLYILRSDADKRLMVTLGSLTTHYRYTKEAVCVQTTADTVAVSIRTPRAEADLELVAETSSTADRPPDGSPFATWQQAQRFAGPLPYTFSYEPETHSMILIEGRRQGWTPQPVTADIRRATFFDAAPFNHAPPVLANTFVVRDIDYSWERGVRESLVAKA